MLLLLLHSFLPMAARTQAHHQICGLGGIAPESGCCRGTAPHAAAVLVVRGVVGRGGGGAAAVEAAEALVLICYWAARSARVSNT